MKNSILFYALGLIGIGALASCTQPATDGTKQFTIELTNTWDQPKTDEPVVISLSEVAPGFVVSSAVVMDGDTEIASQLDDLDGDLKADELAFVIDMPANSTKSLTVTLSATEPQKEYPARVFAQFLLRDRGGKHAPIKSVTVPGYFNFYNMVYAHGPMFESELVAYRLYFNQKQTIDPYGKFKKGLELKDTEFYTNPEQQAAGYGYDVMIVSNSVGIGALKGWDGQQSTHIEPVDYRTETVHATGPIRTITDVTAQGWEYQGKKLTMTTRYILYAGHRDMRVEAIFDEPLGEEVFCSGAMNILGDETVSYSDHDGLVASWGRWWPESDTIRWAKQTAGITTCIPKPYLGEEVSDPEDFLYLISAPGKTGFHYYTAFGSQNETFGAQTSDEWFEYAKQWKQELEHPVKVAIKP